MEVLFSAENFFKVVRKVVKTNGKDNRFYEIKINDVVIVAAVNRKKELLFEKHFRPIIGKTLYELPAGYINKGESPKSSALRELEEETGYKAGKIKKLFKNYMSSGRTKQIMHFFFAYDLTRGRRHIESGEQIDGILWIPIDKALQMIKSGEIKGIDTTACILFLSKYIKDMQTENNR